MAGGFGMLGVFSGIDTATLVKATVAAERGPLNRLEKQRTDWQAKIKALDNVRTPMAQLKEFVDKLRSVQDLRHVTATSSDRSLVTVTASSGATEGVHEVIVGRLATAEREVHAGLTPRETWTHVKGVVGADDEYISAEDISDGEGDNCRFSFQFAGESQVAVDLSAYDETGITLNQLVSEINAAAGYTAAQAVEVGGQYKLRISAAEEGGGRTLTITDDRSVDLLAGTSEFGRTVNGDVGTDALVGAGKLVYTYNGVTRTILTTAGTTLGGLRDLVNNDASNPGVRAAILDYEGASGGRYHLVLTGRDTGTKYAITVESSTTLSGFGAGSWTETQSARNSRIRVDGYPAEGWIENSGNIVTDVIPGVTLSLLRATTTGPTLTGTSSDPSVLTVTAQEGAKAGTSQVEVNQLARAGRQAHTAGLSSLSSAVGAGQFVYSYNGVTRSVATTDVTTLGGLRDLINADAGNPGVTASVLQYGGTYHLMLDGQNTGVGYGITIEGATTLAAFQPGDFTETSAQNARIKLNGFPPGADEWIERSSNVIADVVPGATITLQAVGTSNVALTAPAEGSLPSVTVSLSRNTNQLRSDLENLAQIYNTIADSAKQSASYNAETKKAGALIGDSSLSLIVSRIRAFLSGVPQGFSSDQDAVSMAAQIGLEIDRDGHLNLDQTKFSEAISGNYEAVLELIGAVGTGDSTSGFVQFNSADGTTTAGTYEVEIDFDADGKVSAARFRGKGETDWRLGQVNGNLVSGQSGNAEQWLQLTAVADPSRAGEGYTQQATVRVKQGFAGSIHQELKDLLQERDGAFAMKRTRYDEAVKQLNTRIEVEQARLNDREERLKEKYSRLEATLANLDSFRAAFDAVFSSLEAMSTTRRSVRK